MTAQNIVLPYMRVSPIHIPRRDLVLGISDSLALHVTVVESDDPRAQVLEVTGGIGGPALMLQIYRDNPRRGGWYDYGAPWAPPGAMLWSGAGAISSAEPGSFDVLVPAGALAACPLRCGWAIRLDWADGRHSELLAQGSLHLVPSALTLMTPIPLVTDNFEGIQILGGLIMTTQFTINDLTTIGELPDLGTIVDGSSFVAEHAGTGRHSALAFRHYIAPDIAASVPVSALVAGCVPDGTTNNGPIITAAFATAGELWFPAGVYAIASNVTIPAGKRLRMMAGAVFQVGARITMTIAGLIEAGMGQIFTGPGVVVGLREVRPEWWGARINTPAFDSQPALQAAMVCVQASLNSDGIRPTIRLGAGTYYLGTTWTLTPTANCQLHVAGCGSIFGGTRFVPMANFPVAPVILVDGQTDGIQQITDFALTGFGIIKGGGVPIAGLQIGRTGDATHRLIGLHQSLVEDVTISDISNGILLCHVRLIRFDRCSVWNQNIAGATCLTIMESGWFTGDFEFNGLQLVGNGTVGSIGAFLQTSTPSDGLGVAGVLFSKLITTHCDRSVFVSCASGASIHDIWIEGASQIDFAVSQPIVLAASGVGSYVRNVQISGIFVDGGVDQITLTAVSGGQVLDTRIDGCWLANATGRAVIASASSGTTCSDNTIANNNYGSGGALQFTNAMRFSCHDNTCTHTTTAGPKYLVQVDGTSDYFTVHHNIGAGAVITATVIDLSTGTHKAVDNNI